MNPTHIAAAGTALRFGYLDWRQTVRALHSPQWRECNPLINALFNRVGARGVNAYFIVSAVLFVALVPFCPVAAYVGAVWELAFVVNNFATGLKP